jgi:hypothetical protein
MTPSHFNTYSNKCQSLNTLCRVPQCFLGVVPPSWQLPGVTKAISLGHKLQFEKHLQKALISTKTGRIDYKIIHKNGSFIESASVSLFFFLVGLGVEFRASHLQSRHCTTWATLPPLHFALVILEMGILELFAWAGLKLQSSQSQPSK